MILPELERELTMAVERLRSSVVRIDRPAEPGGGGDDALPYGASATGVVIDAHGLLVTNDHVVRGASRVAVTLPDGSEETGTVLGGDAPTDLAVVRLDRSPLEAATLADSSRVRVGQFAVAIGNALGLPGEPTVSLGVVSALHRPIPGSDFVFEGLMQTDAAINPGNSGGPLATIAGEVMGINTAVVPFAQGVGFAVPSDTVRQVVRDIRSNGRVVRPWLGVSIAALTPPLRQRFRVRRITGLLVASVVPEGPADRAGVRAGDTIFRVGSTGVRSVRDLLQGLAAVPVGGSVDLAFARGARELQTMVGVAEAPTLPTRVGRRRS
ncbi:MAG TPA: trypsin-like peptidase domain-containing protein [Thermoplasmata archaeon]